VQVWTCISVGTVRIMIDDLKLVVSNLELRVGSRAVLLATVEQGAVRYCNAVGGTS